ncbi:MAG: CBS domain-containing protein [Betaproteobacteria bacterium]|nr:CBS domain-containing protein [Betaproteobacteria bacterium]MCL2885370.1 CBS domain-containing protein [Betaproteobacteria bacterium]
MLVREMLDFGETEVHTLSPRQTLADALAMMAERHVGVLVVMEGETLAGMLTHRELISAIHARRDIENAPIGDFMIKNPITASPDTHLNDLRRLMVVNRSRYIPVLEDGKLKGAVSFLDVAKAVLEEQDLENRMLKQYIRHWPEGEEPQQSFG